MKKTYTRPVLVTNPFNADDGITVSAPVIEQPALGSTHNSFPVDNIPLGDITFN